MPTRTFSMSAPDGLRDVGELVHEADLGRQHGIGGILGQLRRAHVHQHDAVAVSIERGIECAQQLAGARIVRADDDAVRAHEVFDRGAFLQELGIGHDVEFQVDATGGLGVAHRARHLVRGSHGHGRLVHHNAVAVHVLADAACHREHVSQIGRAVFVRRGADRDKLKQTVPYTFLGIGREGQPAGLTVVFDQLVEARLVDRHSAAVEQRDFFGIDVDA
jgi:hypothetical protein